jgi:ATP-dependent DNA ligase
LPILRPGFIAPCLPSKVERPPSGPRWVHEIKHDGYRLMLRRDGSRVRCFTRNGHVCRMGLEGIVSKRTDAPYRSGPSKTWLKSKNPASEAVRREREEDWR